MSSAAIHTRVSRDVYEAGVSALLDVFEAMVAAAELAVPQAKWDEEYAECAVDDCLDRMFCAGPHRPRPELSERYGELRRRARPYIDEGVPLPGAWTKFTLTEKQLVDLARTTRQPTLASNRELWREYGRSMGFDPDTVDGWGDSDPRSFYAAGARIEE